MLAFVVDFVSTMRQKHPHATGESSTAFMDAMNHADSDNEGGSLIGLFWGTCASNHNPALFPVLHGCLPSPLSCPCLCPSPYGICGLAPPSDTHLSQSWSCMTAYERASIATQTSRHLVVYADWKAQRFLDPTGKWRLSSARSSQCALVPALLEQSSCLCGH